MPTLSIVIVNWNSGRQLASCLASVPPAVTPALRLDRVIVVDNASTDGSADHLPGAGLPLRIERNEVNRGFAAACNQGAALTAAEYLLFLNPDVRLFPEALQVPIAYLEHAEHAQVGICGIQLVDEQQRVAPSCARFPSPGNFLAAMVGLDRLLPGRCSPHYLAEREHQASADVDQVMGAFFLVRAALFRALNGFDERFFVYYEEVDFSLRAHEAGWKSRYLAEVRAFHRGEGTTDQIRGRRLFLSLRSRLLYCFKHFGTSAATAVLVGTLFVEPVTRSLLALRRRGWLGVRETVTGSLALWRSLPDILRVARTDRGGPR